MCRKTLVRKGELGAASHVPSGHTYELNYTFVGPLLSGKFSQEAPNVLRSESCPPPTSFWSSKDSVGAGRALPFPVDHTDVQCVVAEGLQARQHAMSLASLESEDLFLKMASVSLRRTLCLPVVNLKEQGQMSAWIREQMRFFTKFKAYAVS